MSGQRCRCAGCQGPGKCSCCDQVWPQLEDDGEPEVEEIPVMPEILELEAQLSAERARASQLEHDSHEWMTLYARAVELLNAERERAEAATARAEALAAAILRGRDCAICSVLVGLEHRDDCVMAIHTEEAAPPPAAAPEVER